MTTSLGQTVLMNDLSPVRLVAITNVVGTYYNGPSNNGVGATLTVAASSLTIDSVVVAQGDRVLLQNQTIAYQNGIYVVESIGSTVVLKRAFDQQNIEQLKAGQFTIVGAGTVNQGAGYSLVEPLPQEIGVDSMLYVATSVNSGGLTDTLPDGDIFVGNGSNVATAVTPSGDITLSNLGVFGIASDSIVNADVNSAASIAFSKLATLASANILVGSAGGVPTSVAMTGDVTISNTGVTSLAALSIVNADISASAAIDFSKLAPLSSAELLVGSAGGVATAVAVTGDVTISNAGVTAIAADSIVNADVNTAAAIAFSKLETLASANILVGSAGGVPTSVAMTGDIAIDNAGATTIQAAAVDSSMMNANMLRYAAVTMSAAEFNGAYVTPHLLVAAAGANTLLVLEGAYILMTYGTTQFANGGVAHIQYDSTTLGAGIIASTTQAAANFFDAASTALYMNPGVVKQPFTTAVNTGLYFSNVTGAFDTGDSTFVVHIWYRVIPTV